MIDQAAIHKLLRRCIWMLSFSKNKIYARTAEIYTWFWPSVFNTMPQLSLSLFIHEINQFGHKRSQHRLDMGGTNRDRHVPSPISKYFNKKRVPTGIRTHDLPHNRQRRYPLHHKSLDNATHGICLILSLKN